MPGCVLHVTGEAFDVDAFLANSSLEPYRIHHRGETGLRSRHLEHSGFCVDVSSVNGDLKAQVVEAISFLTTHEAELLRARRFPGVTDARLDFGYYFREVPAQYEFLPPDLLARAGNLGVGIELSLYVRSESDENPGS